MKQLLETVENCFMRPAAHNCNADSIAVDVCNAPDFIKETHFTARRYA